MLADAHQARLHPTTDWAQLTCITATLLGIDAAVALAAKELGSAGVETMLAYLQLPALGRDLRRAVKASDVYGTFPLLALDGPDDVTGRPVKHFLPEGGDARLW